MQYKVTQEMHTVTIVTVNDKIGQLQSSHILSWLFNDQFLKLKVEIICLQLYTVRIETASKNNKSCTFLSPKEINFSIM
jgi:hypothetical protein